MKFDKNYFLFSKPIAHRGLWGEDAKENTILSYQKAISMGFPIEIDLYQTKDKQIVCIHDKNLLRLTGLDKNVYDLTLSELKQLFVQNSNQKIPTLKEVLELCLNKAPLLIELKNQPYKDYVENVVNILKEYKGEFAVQSFNPFYISKIKKLAPNFVRGILASNTPDTTSKIEYFVVKRMPFNFLAKPHFISYEHTGLPLKNKKNLPVIAWTVTSKEIADKIKPYVKNIIFESFIPNE